MTPCRTLSRSRLPLIRRAGLAQPGEAVTQRLIFSPQVVCFLKRYARACGVPAVLRFVVACVRLYHPRHERDINESQFSVLEVTADSHWLRKLFHQ